MAVRRKYPRAPLKGLDPIELRHRVRIVRNAYYKQKILAGSLSYFGASLGISMTTIVGRKAIRIGHLEPFRAC